MGDFVGEGIVYNFKLWQNEVDLSGATTGPPNTSGYTNCGSCTWSGIFTPCTDTLNACVDGDHYLCVEDVPKCNTCFDGCKSCSGNEYYECTSCMAGFFLLEGFMCVEDCPNGLKTNITHRKCEVIDGDRLSLGADFNNLVSVKHHKFKKEPYPSKLRGYYFNQNSTGEKRNFVIGPEFTILGWIRLKEDGILLSKGYTEPILRFTSEKLQVNIETESGETVSLESTSSFKDTWTYFSVSGEILSDGKTKFVLKVNDTQDHDYTTPEATFFLDNKQVGFELVLGNDTNSFIGFLWSIRIYNTHGMEGFSTTGCPSECSGFCPTEKICPSDCELDHYPDGTGCSPCKAECTKGCVRPENCHLCADELCRRCGYFTEFYGSQKSCSRCKSNADFNGNICECNLKYYKNETVKACHACTPGCDRCTSSLFTNCTQCSPTHFSIQGVCHPFCPSGGCDPVDDFVFHLKPHAFQDTVTDTQSFIPVLTGDDNSFYPTPGAYDPIPAKDRGYYFTSTSYMQLPPYNSVTTPLLTLAPEFTIAMWIRPTADFGTLLTKQRNSSTVSTKFEVLLNSKQPQVDLDLTLTPHSSTDSIKEAWNFLVVGTHLDPSVPEFRVSAYLDTTQVISSSLGNDWLVDLEDSYLFSIGAKHSDQTTFNNFYTGFLWEIRIYNSHKGPTTLLESSGCDSCSFCPIDNQNECLPSCLITEFWDGNDCVECDSECTSGCSRQHTCNLCANFLCASCSSFEEEDCSECKANASGNPCVCDPGYGLDRLDLECIECELSMGREVVNGKCYCAKGYFNNNSTGIDCQECHSTCETCSGPEPTDCLSCDGFYLYEDGSCGPCPDGTYLEGTECLECMELCAICTSEDECTNCVENAFINLNNTCSCNKGFTSLNNTCECLSGSIRDEVCTDFHSNLTCDNDNLLTLTFSEELVSSLTKEGIAIQLQNKTIEYTYSFKEVNKAKYEMKLEFNTYYVSEGELATLKFLSEINSTSGFSLGVKQLETNLSKHDTYNPLVDNGKGTAQVVLGVAGAMGGVSILINGNPADIWSMLNNIQLLSYLVMSNNPLTPTLKGLFEGLDVFQYISDLFSYLLKLLTGKDSKHYEEKYGITSEMFLFNAGVNIVIMFLMLLSWPIVWLLSKIPRLQNRLKPMLREYRYNAFLRYWIQCYLELSIACFIQVSSVPDSETIGVANFIVGFLITLSIVATPFVLFGFCKKYRDWITNLTDESNFHLSWGTLFYEFGCSSNFNPSLTYPVFILRRMLLSISLVLLGDLPYIQAGINAALAIGYTVFLFKVTPYKEAKTQLASTSAEVVISLVFLLVIYFLQTDSRSIDWLVEISVICSTVGAIVFQSLVTICYFVYQKCCKKEQVEISGVTEIDSTQNHLFFHRRNQAKVVPEVKSPENKETENDILEDPN